MELETEKPIANESSCRALVPLTVPDARDARACPRPNAAFVTQLAANASGLSPYRAKRREQPEIGAARYRDTVADALACRPGGQRLNYVA
jgi:hypothetical protein